MNKILFVIILISFWIFGCSKKTNPTSEPSSTAATNIQSHRTKQIKPVSVQCRATTKKGKRCQRMTTDPSGYCYQHK